MGSSGEWTPTKTNAIVALLSSLRTPTSQLILTRTQYKRMTQMWDQGWEMLSNLSKIPISKKATFEPMLDLKNHAIKNIMAAMWHIWQVAVPIPIKQRETSRNFTLGKNRDYLSMYVLRNGLKYKDPSFSKFIQWVLYNNPESKKRLIFHIDVSFIISTLSGILTPKSNWNNSLIIINPKPSLHKTQLQDK